jgi:Ala-tRNA(Pro) deacylase
MAIAMTIEKYLEDQHVPYEVLKHPHTGSSLRSAEMSHVAGRNLAKAVMLEDDKGYLMAVLPANRRVNRDMLCAQLHRNLEFATEMEIGDWFRDCEMGAIPPLGPAYGIETVCDDELMDRDDIYFEAGNHEELIHVTGPVFRKLLLAENRAYLCQVC